MHRTARSRPPECEWKWGEWRLWNDRLTRRIAQEAESVWGSAPNPGIFPLCCQDFWEAGVSSTHARRIPAPGSALEVRPRRALSSAQVASAYQALNMPVLVRNGKNKEIRNGS
jgi:hypothetical protein